MPLHRRLPKRGFNKRNRKEFNEINLGRLQAAVDAKLIDAGKPWTPRRCWRPASSAARSTACACWATAS